MKQCVLIDCLGFVCLAITAHIRRNGAITRSRKYLQLISPRIPRFWPPITEQHQRTLASLGHVYFYAVGRYEFVGNLQARILRSISLRKFRSSYQPGCRTVGNAPAPTVTSLRRSKNSR